MYSSFLLIILCGVFVDVHCWGSVGHRIVARLAQNQLNDKATIWVRSLIPWHWEGNMSAVASWADEILYADANSTGHVDWQWSRPFHYINTPDWACNYRAERDCINDVCIDGAVRNYTKRLESKLDFIQHQEALYFLIHYVGDIHQPLHTGFTSDHGGNAIHVRFLNRSGQTNLHSLWDSTILNERMKRNFSSNENLFYDYIHDQMINHFPLPIGDYDIPQWIDENIAIVCQQMYLDEDNQRMNASMTFNLSEGYYLRSYPIIEQRLIQGGYRLGALINRLANVPTTEISTTINLKIIIIVFFVGFVIAIILAATFLVHYLIKRRRK